MTRFQREVVGGKAFFSLNLACNFYFTALRCSMTKRIQLIAFAACMARLLPIGMVLFFSMPTAQAKQCSVARPSNAHGHWSYRLIDGRKCWYQGEYMLSKSLLQWPAQAAQPVSHGGPLSVLTEKPNIPLNSQAWAPDDSDSFEARWSARVGKN